MVSLNSLVHDLARPHATRIATESGSRTGFELPLIHQLRIERTSGSRMGGSSGTGSRIPVALDASNVYQDIVDTLSAWHREITGHTYGTPEQMLVTWAWWAQSPTIAGSCGESRAVEAHTACTLWTKQIRDLLNPIRRVELAGACPSCQEEYAWENVQGARTRLHTAITAVGAEASCHNCGTSWAGKDLHRLALSFSGAA